MRDSSDDLPAFGRPTSPTSASSLRWSSTAPSSPGSPRSASRGACRTDDLKRVLPRPPAPPRGDRDLLAGPHEVVARAVPARDLRAGRHGDHERLAVGAVALGALAVAAALGAEVRAAAEALQVAQVVVAAQHDVAAAAAVAAVGPALGHVRLAPERQAAVAARAGAHFTCRSLGALGYVADDERSDASSG